ncbi:hypothetical protein ACHHYP_16238 [Achlya hypogyna]|uniref:Uncharacterized protein n=1 Tax=Achlya hypogyna TaxID=1202772 RepID=A0A1V9Y997_ACHHY|nr:hypothetical protein ACHHYP_16238 [Achlya hypogyna]
MYSMDVCRPVFLTAEVPETDDLFPEAAPVAVAQRLALLSLLQSPRQPEGVDRSVQVQARFSFIENRYGTRPAQPRKVHKRTLARLADPILGHTSTLQALPPAARKRREAEDERIERAMPAPKRTVKLPIKVKSTASRDLKVKAPSCFLTQLVPTKPAKKPKKPPAATKPPLPAAKAPVRRPRSSAPTPLLARRPLPKEKPATAKTKRDEPKVRRTSSSTQLPPIRPAGVKNAVVRRH